MQSNKKRGLIKKGIYILPSLFISISSCYSGKSGGVMLSSFELDTIGLRKTAGLKNGEIRLDGILYQSPDKWTIWLNGQPSTPKNHPDGVTIVSVTPHTVELKRFKKTVREDVLEEADEDADEEDEMEEVDFPAEEKVYSLIINQIVRLK